MNDLRNNLAAILSFADDCFDAENSSDAYGLVIEGAVGILDNGPECPREFAIYANRAMKSIHRMVLDIARDENDMAVDGDAITLVADIRREIDAARTSTSH